MRRTLIAVLSGASLLAAVAAQAAGPLNSPGTAVEPIAAQSTQAYDPATAASAAEDMVDFALAGERARVETKLNELRSQLPQLQQALGEKAATEIERRTGEIESALGRDQLVEAALLANETFRTIVEARGPVGGVPLEVSLLDYSGFRLKALASAGQPDWSAVAGAAQESGGWWQQLIGRIQDKGLRDLMNTLQEGLSQAVTEKNAAQLAFAAQMQLDAVDLLEKAFAK